MIELIDGFFSVYFFFPSVSEKCLEEQCNTSISWCPQRVLVFRYHFDAVSVKWTPPSVELPSTRKLTYPPKKGMSLLKMIFIISIGKIWTRFPQKLSVYHAFLGDSVPTGLRLVPVMALEKVLKALAATKKRGAGPKTKPGMMVCGLTATTR